MSGPNLPRGCVGDNSYIAGRSSEGGVAGEHSPAATGIAYVGPSTADQSNLIVSPLIPIACWRVDDIRFDFGSSFPMPEIAAELAFLAELRDKHKRQLPADSGTRQPAAIYPPLSIFGHADPVGADDENKALSGRRATAVYALLTRNTSLWEKLYSKVLDGDNWGLKSVQVMLAAAGFSPGNINGSYNESTRGALNLFQKANGLAVDGNPGPQTRVKLFLAYMDKLCGDDLKLDPAEDFLARGSDAGGKGDRQGCGEFNPVLLFSRKEEEDFSSAASRQRRDAENASNRRVVVLLFRPGARVSAARWPCPRVDEDAGACKKRFWSDGEKRRTTRLPEERRSFEQSGDTFACRFYHRMTSSSPCEGLLPVFRIRLFDRFGRAMPHAPYSVILAGRELPPGTADEKGDAILRNVPAGSSCIVRWSHPKREEDDPPVYGDDDGEEALL